MCSPETSSDGKSVGSNGGRGRKSSSTCGESANNNSYGKRCCKQRSLARDTGLASKPSPGRRKTRFLDEIRSGVGLLCYGLVVAAAGLTYANSLRGEFVHDDIVAVVKNGDARGETSIWQTFKNDFWGVPMTDPSSHKSYRPLTILTFRLNALFSSENVIGYHALNVILHVIVSVQLAELCRGCLAWSWESSLAAATLFATHPVHTEAVSSIVGRAELLCSVFFMLGLMLFIRSGPDRSGRCLAAVCACAACAMLAKEQGVTLLFVCLTYDIVCRPGNRWRRRRSLQLWLQETIDKSTLTLIASMALIVGFRLWILHGSMPQFSDQDNPASQAPHILTRFLTYLHLPAVNAWLLLCPLTLAYDWQLGSIPLVTSLGDPRNAASLAFYAALFALAYRLWIVPKDSCKEDLCLGFSVLAIPFMPATNLFFPVGFVVAERVLYTPSIGYCLLFAMGLQALVRRCRRESLWMLRTCTLFLLALLWLRSVHRNQDWASRETLFRSGLESTPGNAKIHYNYGNLQKDLGQTESAVKHYRIALSLWPNYVSAHNNLGTLLTDSSQAEKHFRTAMLLDPKHARAHYNLAALYKRKGQTDIVLWLLNRAIELDSELDEAYALLNAVYAENKSAGKNQSDAKKPNTANRWSSRSSQLSKSDNGTSGDSKSAATSALLYSMAVKEVDQLVKR